MNNIEYEKIINNIERNPRYQFKEGRLFRLKKNKLLRVVRDFEYEGILYMIHDHELAGHFGIKACQEKAKELYWWKNMNEHIEKYVKSCDKCQKRGKPQKKNELTPIEVKEPFECIGIDFVGPLESTKRRNRYIIVAMDYFTKWPEAKATKRDTAEEVVKFIYEDIICRHGCPKRIISDRGTHFNNKVVELLLEKFKIKHNLSTAYHPETNGLVERFNRTLCESLAKVQVNGQWDDKIPSVLYAYRNRKHSTTKCKPFYLVYGRNTDIIEPLNKEEDRIVELTEKVYETRQRAREEIDRAQLRQKEAHDKEIKVQEKFQIGDRVLKYKADRSNSKSGKLDEKWKGPYLIYEVGMKGSYKLKELEGSIIKTPVNGRLLKRYNDRNDL